jgi:flagellar motor switch protein FliM
VNVETYPIDQSQLHRLVTNLFEYQAVPPLEKLLPLHLKEVQTLLVRRYQLNALKLSASSWSWEEGVGDSISLGTDSMIVRVSYRPIEISFYWMIGNQEFEYLLSCALFNGQHNPEIEVAQLESELKKELKQYLIAAVLLELDKQSLPIKLEAAREVDREAFSALTNQAAYAMDLSIAIGDREMVTRLILFKEDHDRLYSYVRRQQQQDVLESSKSKELSIDLQVVLPLVQISLDEISKLEAGDLVCLPHIGSDGSILDSVPVEIYYQDLLVHRGKLENQQIVLASVDEDAIHF